MSKRRRGFPSETKVKRGIRIVHGDKLLEESTSTDCVFLTLARDQFLKLLEHQPKLREAVEKVVAERLKTSDKAMKGN